MPDEQTPPVPSSAARVWVQFRDMIFERMDAIDAAVIALRDGALSQEVRQKGVLEAHRMAGSLGMFGLAEGTRIAREIEHGLAGDAPTGPEISAHLVASAAALRKILERGPV